MRPIRKATSMLVAAALTLSGVAVAATPEDEHSAHHPAQEQAAAANPAGNPRMQALQERMKAMREAKDPKERARLMEEQMAAMESMMKDMQQCPMMGGGSQGGMGMMGGRGGMGMGMMGGTQNRMSPDMMQQRMEMMDKRMDMMQMMMQMMMGNRGGTADAPTK